MNPRILVVVPCLNEAGHLPGLLRFLLAEAEPSHTIVVADGGSADGSQSIVREFARQHANLHLLINEARIQSAGINAAVRAFGAGCAFLVRVDAHARYPARYAERLVAMARRRGADAVVVPMTTAGRTCFQTAAATAQNSAIGTGGSAHRMGRASAWVDHGHHALISLERFDALGGYDERFSHNEDAEFDARLTAAGGRIWLERALELHYSPRAGPRALLRQYFNYGRGRARTVKLHRMRLRPRQAIPLAVLPAAAFALAAPFAMAVDPLGVLLILPATGWAAACVLGGGIAARRARGACAWGAGPVAMLMHLGWSAGYWREWLGGGTMRARPTSRLLRPSPASERAHSGRSPGADLSGSRPPGAMPGPSTGAEGKG